MALSLKAVTQKSKKRCKDSMFLIPYLFTFANALFGFLAVVESIQGNTLHAACCIGLAALMDLFDGRVARALGSTSFIGAELDTLCDAVSFCFAPTMLLYNFYDFDIVTFGTMALVFYLCAGLFRLARFNVMPTNSGNFSGLPTPVSAFFLSSTVIYQQWFMEHMPRVVTPTHHSLFIIGLGLLMISSIPFPSFKTVHINARMLYLGLLACIILGVVALYLHLPLVFLAVGTYVFGAMILALLQFIKTWVSVKS